MRTGLGGYGHRHTFQSTWLHLVLDINRAECFLGVFEIFLFAQNLDHGLEDPKTTESMPLPVLVRLLTCGIFTCG